MELGQSARRKHATSTTEISGFTWSALYKVLRMRKRYLALVLRLHPDKVAQPRAAEAFAAVEATFRRTCSGK